MRQFIQLRHHGDQITVSEEGYETIRALVSQVRICERCEGSFTEKNPRVALNRCANCFISEHRQRYGSLSLLGPKEGSYREGGEYNYLFLDGRGTVYYSITTQKELYESAYETLVYHGFPVPVHYQRLGKEFLLQEQN